VSGSDDAWMLDLFREEAGTQLAALSDGLMALEAATLQRPVLETLMRAAHSMKGAARIAGLEPLVKLTHAIEDIFVAALAGQCDVDATAIDLLLGMVDFLVEVSNDPASLDGHGKQLPALLAQLQALRSGRLQSASAATTEVPKPDPSASAPPNASSRVTPGAPTAPIDIADLSLLELFREEADGQLTALTDGLMALESASNPRVVLETLMRAAHSLKGAARIIGLDSLVKLTHATEDLFVAALADKIRIDSAAVDVLLGIVDHIADVASGDLARTTARAQQLPDTLQSLAALRAGQLPVSVTAASATSSAAAGAAAPSAEAETSNPSMSVGTAARPSTAVPARSIRMTAATLERLTVLAAEAVLEAERFELMMEQARLGRGPLRNLQSALGRLRDVLGAGSIATPSEQAAAQRQLQAAQASFDALRALQSGRDDALEAYARRMSALARKLSRESLASRMLPFGTLLRGFPRLVRDVSRDLGKQCRLEIHGEKTLIDREILEQLDAPLNHLVRNGLDHGLEMPSSRLAAGKPAEGRLEIAAAHRFGRLQVTVRDDGLGIDIERLRRKIVERSLESQDTASRLSAEELHEFLFLPGFSTASQVTELSGRGVGLDAVRTQVKEAGGNVILASTPGLGTSFTLELPVTRALTRALVVLVGEDRYALAVVEVERALRIEHSALQDLQGRPGFAYEGATVPLVSAADLLEVPGGEQPAGAPCVVLLRTGDQRIGVAVDAFDGERSFVVRPLDGRLGKVAHVAAASTDEHGHVVLILDAAEVARTAAARALAGLKESTATTPAAPTLFDDAAASTKQAPRKRILVVDDSVTIRQARRQVLEAQGYAVDAAVDGMEGWSALRLGSYDLVLSDLDMPRMNGVELVRRIRADARLAALPVVIVSYRDREEDRRQGLEAGANHYLTKGGLQDAALFEVIGRLIGPQAPP
jgi:two-component system sensor histidine kinase and response regulator WspE